VARSDRNRLVLNKYGGMSLKQRGFRYEVQL
jgi:hypothetical protein